MQIMSMFTIRFPSVLVLTIYLIASLKMSIGSELARTERPPAPSGLKLIRVTSSSVSFRWSYADHHPTSVTSFEATLRPVKVRVMATDVAIVRRDIVNGYAREATIDRLSPDTEFSVTVSARNQHGLISNNSEVIAFRTLTATLSSVGEPVSEYEYVPHQQMHSAEIVLIILVVGAWAGAVALFLHRWGRIRIVQQREFNFRHSPMNLDRVKIVKRCKESIIYRTYPPYIASVFDARERRHRLWMQSMPNIKVTLVDSDTKKSNVDINGREVAASAISSSKSDSTIVVTTAEKAVAATSDGDNVGCFGTLKRTVPLIQIGEEHLPLTDSTVVEIS